MFKIYKLPYYRSLGIKLTKDYKSRPAIVIGLWKYAVRIEL